MIGYLLPIRRAAGESPDEELASYLQWLTVRLDEVVVVDGSGPAEFAEHRRAWGPSICHVAPNPDMACLNGKVHGVLTGLLLARADLLIIADDDVRYDGRSLAALLVAAETADS